MFEILPRAQLLGDGYSADEVRRLLAGGDLLRVRRGAYVRSPEELSVEASHLRLVEAVLRQHPGPAVVSHQSAAVVHGLPVWSSALVRVHLTRPRTGGGKVRGGVELHASVLQPDDMTTVGGVLATTLARTVVDLARTRPVDEAVAAGDAALRRGMDRAQLERVLSHCRGWPAIGRARRVVELLDGRSESFGESVSRVRIHDASLPRPVPQLEMRDGTGQLVARADFGWEEQRVLGEFDGKIKYGRLLRPGQDITDVVYREKLREDACRDLGWRMVRWTWPDLHPGTVLTERLARVLR
jgi:hypothetical protein